MAKKKRRRCLSRIEGYTGIVWWSMPCFRKKGHKGLHTDGERSWGRGSLEEDLAACGLTANAVFYAYEEEETTMQLQLDLEVSGVDEDTLQDFLPLLQEELRGQIEGSYTFTDTDGSEKSARVTLLAS